MKNNLKFSVVIFTICITLSCIAYASNVSNIKVLINHINIMINGEKVKVDNLLYNDTTYVPLRKVAELFSKEVKWHDKTNTVNIVDEFDKDGDYYTECESLKTIFIIDNSDNNLELEFQLKNITNKDITITLDSLFYDIVIYDENDYEVYVYSKDVDFITVIRDEIILSGKKYITNNTIELKDKNLISGKIYKAVFYTEFEIKSDNKKYKLSREAYFIK